MIEEFPITVAVERGGRVEEVRVGSAVRSGDGFVLRFVELRINTGSGAEASARRAAPLAAPPGGGLLLPNYGRSKGQPIAGASLQDLEYYAAGCRRTLADPGKARFHDKERVLLAAIEAEITRQKGMPPLGDDGSADEFGPPPDTEEVPF